MHIREANITDIQVIADIGAKAFKSDPFFNFFCTYDDDHPNDVYRWLAGELREAMLAPAKVVMVVTMADIDTKNADAGMIAGWAYWERRGSDPAASKWQEDRVEKVVIRQLDSCKSFAEELASEPNHSFKQDRYDHYHNLAERTFLSMPDRWHLQLVAVHPDHQRQGVASALLQWGFDNATKEKVPIALESTQKGQKLYEKHGFLTKENLVLRPALEVPAMYWLPAAE